MKTKHWFCLLLCSSLIVRSQTNSGVTGGIDRVPVGGISFQTNSVPVLTNSISVATNSVPIGVGVLVTNVVINPSGGPVINPGINNPGLSTNVIIVTNIVTLTNSVSNQVGIVIIPCLFAFPSNYVDPGGILAGFTTNLLRSSFDNVFSGMQLPFAINFYGNLYSNVWVNEDGTVTLDGPFWGHIVPSYVPSQALSQVNRAIFAPFWADLDTTTNGSGVVSFGTGCAFANGFGRQAFSATWSNVGYYKGHNDKVNTFQMLLIQRPDVGNGSFDLQYRYGGIQWDTADSAAGASGLCIVLGGVQNGYPARVGFANTNYFFELPGSGTANALLNNGPNSLTANSTNSTVSGVYTWHFINGWPQ